MNILMVLSTQAYPPDRRVEREARDLIADGHHVFLIARQKSGQSREECVDGVQVIRVPVPFEGRGVLNDVAYYFWQRLLIVRHIIRACRLHSIDIIHVHDLPYAFATALAARRLGIPFVFDMHEHYTAMMRSGFEARTYRYFKPVAGLLLWWLSWEERFTARRAAQVVVVAREHIPRIQSLGVDPGRILEITNTDDLDEFSGFPDATDTVDHLNGSLILLYVGVLNPHRGLSTVIQAIPDLAEAIPDIRLVVVGDGPSRRELEELAESLNVGEHVSFEGHQSFSLLPTYIRRSDIGLIPHISTPHIETTMPNKIFQYMLLACPVLVSNVAPLVRIVDETKCGQSFSWGDPKSFAEAVNKMRRCEHRKSFGENGLEACRQEYHWQATVKPLLEFYLNPPIRPR